MARKILCINLFLWRKESTTAHINSSQNRSCDNSSKFNLSSSSHSPNFRYGVSATNFFSYEAREQVNLPDMNISYNEVMR